jgi:putative transposase
LAGFNESFPIKIVKLFRIHICPKGGTIDKRKTFAYCRKNNLLGVGWAFADTLATTLPLSALDMALTQRKPPAGLVHHSDRGVQYASAAYRHRLAQAGVVPSMSRRGNCYDNAMMESFWSTMKRELIHRCLFATRAQARAALFEWIEIFYNRTRFHSALGYKSPVDFETHLN